MTKLKVKTFGEFLRNLREEAGLPLRTVAIELSIDPSLLGKIERNERQATKEFIKHVSDFYKINQKELLVEFISDQIAYKVLDNDEGVKILKVAEQKIKYLSKSH